MTNSHRHTGPRPGSIRLQIEGLLARGLSSREIADALGCAESYPDKVRLFMRNGEPIDSSCPRFAHHDAHVAAVMSAGGFYAIQGRQLVGPGRAA